MDPSETLAEQYLLARGHKDILYEPDGNYPPDFLIDGRTAVEVRRLNTNLESNGRVRGLEEDAQPLWDSIRSIAESLGPEFPSENWYISFSFRRPYGSRRAIIRETKLRLEEFALNATRQDTHWQITPGFRLEVWRGSTRHHKLFSMGGWIDHDAGGWVLEDLQHNLAICINEKSLKQANAKRHYREWWLVLVDHISYGSPKTTIASTSENTCLNHLVGTRSCYSTH